MMANLFISLYNDNSTTTSLMSSKTRPRPSQVYIPANHLEM